MSILGIELEANNLRWVEVHSKGSSHEVGALGKIKLEATRDATDGGAVKNFGKAFLEVLRDVGPTEIAIKEKPEIGRMRAGAASLKMEALVLYLADAPVQFIKVAAINKCQERHPRVKDVALLAYRTAVCAAG